MRQSLARRFRRDLLLDGDLVFFTFPIMNPTRFLSLTVLFCVIVGSLLAAHDESGDVAAVLAADRARGAALLAADVKALDGLLADDLRYTHSTGKLETKAIHIGTIKDGLRYSKFETSDLNGHVIVPGVVVLNGKIDQTKVSQGKPSDSHLFFHAVWRKDPAGWHLASLQTATIPAK